VAGKKKNADGARERGGFKTSRHGNRASAAGPKAQQKRAAEEREASGTAGEGSSKGGKSSEPKAHSRFLSGGKISPHPISGRETVAELVDNAFLA
jgi:hypothetical protein